MNTYSFRKDLLAVQEELLRFAYKLTSDRDEPTLKVGCIPLCVTSL